jgi:hypothetical protein
MTINPKQLISLDDPVIPNADPWLWDVPQLHPRQLSPGRPRDADVDRESKARRKRTHRVHHARSMRPGSQAPHASCAAPSGDGMRPSMPRPGP